METAEFGIFFVSVTIAILFDSCGEMDNFQDSNVSCYHEVQFVISQSQQYISSHMKPNNILNCLISSVPRLNIDA